MEETGDIAAAFAEASAAALPRDPGSLEPVWAWHLHTATDVGSRRAFNRFRMTIYLLSGFACRTEIPKIKTHNA